VDMCGPLYIFGNMRTVLATGAIAAFVTGVIVAPSSLSVARRSKAGLAAELCKSASQVGAMTSTGANATTQCKNHAH
jgi:gas vesicle protein